MLSYENLKEKPREFLAATGLTHEEFAVLLPNFETAYEKLYPSNVTFDGKERQRIIGGGVNSKLSKFENRLLFILVYQKTNPLQTMHGLHFGLSQAQTNYWIHRLLPVLRETLAAIGMKPERDAVRVASNPETGAGGANLVIDGTERRLQRPTDPIKQKENYSGKKKAHTDKNILVVNENSRKVVYLSPTVVGKKHDSRAAKEVAIRYPANATLSKDTGFQGYEPEGVLTIQPKKRERSRVEFDRQTAEQTLFECENSRGECDRRSEAVSNCQRAVATNQRWCIRHGHGNSLWFAQSQSYLPSTTGDP